MSILEFIVAWASNFSNAFIFFSVVSAILLIGSVVWWANVAEGPEYHAGALANSLKLMQRSAWSLVLFVVLASIPSPDGLWRVRVAFLKLELASPENLRVVGSHVEDIVKSLECKHLNVNCPEAPKSEKK